MNHSKILPSLLASSELDTTSSPNMCSAIVALIAFSTILKNHKIFLAAENRTDSTKSGVANKMQPNTYSEDDIETIGEGPALEQPSLSSINGDDDRLTCSSSETLCAR